MPPDFRSRTFSQFVDEDERRTMREDLPHVLEVKKNWEVAIGLAQETMLQRTKRQRLEGVEKIRDSLHISRATAEAIFRFIQFFLRHSIRSHTKHDTIDDLVADVSLLWGESTNEQRNLLRARLTSIRQQAPEYKRMQLRKETLSGVLPTFVACGTTVAMRGVFDKELMFGERADEFAGEVRPSGEDPAVPVVSIAFSVDVGTPDTFFFQTDLEALEFLVEKLKFALLQAKSLQDCVTYKGQAGVQSVAEEKEK